MSRWIVVFAVALAGCKKEDPPPPPEPTDTGTPPPPPTSVTPVGTPMWEISDFALATGPSGEGPMTCLLNGPHAWDGTRWIPGDAHDPPYATELRDKMSTCGLSEREDFVASEMEAPNGVWLLMMVTPKTGNAPGSSPDFGLGDVVYEDRFPMVVDADVRRGEILVDIDHDFVFPTTTDLGYVVTGHSHVPMVFRTGLDRMPAGATSPGEYLWQVSIRDATSIVSESGYDFELAYTVTADATGE